LAARIFAVVDVWDALSSNRPYREAWRREDIINQLIALKGKQFDPTIVDKFLNMVEPEP
jgi:HD-GYP domain-containing protein (c-di-GMP phosphodiesterase class II)